LNALHEKARAAHVAEIVSDRQLIENLLKERIGLTPDPESDHFALASFYDRTGRYTEALSEWRAASTPKKGSYHSFLSDPNVLSHFGDLALRLGYSRLAEHAYEQAGGLVLQSANLDPSDVPPVRLSALMEAAHFASAEWKVPHGLLLEALGDFKVGMPLMHGSYSAHLDYGRLLRRLGHLPEAKKEYRTAERMAPDLERTKAIHKERLQYGLIQTQGVLIIKDGKASTYIKELPDRD
jgi:tetratricopeptide (TPR) repeat protein